jgi:AraC-like DNA-binding protein
MREQDLENWIKCAEKADYRVVYFAKNLGICRKQLERWTKLYFGQTPQEWLDVQRLNKAIELLNRNNSLKEVATKLGFKQFSHFSRKFKIYHGLPPKHFVAWLKTEQDYFRSHLKAGLR